MHPSEFGFNLVNYQEKDRWVRVTRHELYVSAPIILVAKELGISDRGWRRPARGSKLPVSPHGHWAQASIRRVSV